MKLAVFDFDSTLMDGETIDFLADEFGIGDKIAQITEQSMAGKIDFFQSLLTRVNLLKGMDYEKVVKICSDLPLMRGSYEVVKELQSREYKVVCFSGGFTLGTAAAKEKLGLNGHFSNILHEKNGVLTGLVGGDMMFSDSKGYMISKLQELLSVSKKDTLVCGDGANDISMFKYADTRIAFCAKEVLKKEANIIIENKDLTQILTKI